MRHLRNMLQRTRSIVCKRMSRMNRRLSTIEHTLESQSERLTEMEAIEPSNTHDLEVEQSHLQDSQSRRRLVLSDDNFRLDLEEQYGTTRWAVRLIDELIHARQGERGSMTRFIETHSLS